MAENTPGDRVQADHDNMYRDDDGKVFRRVAGSFGGSLIAGLDFDEVQATYPDSITEVYTFKNATVTVATVTLVYTDSCKDKLQSAVRT